MLGHRAQLCPTHCNPISSSPPGSSVHGISQARILEWVTFPPSEDLPVPELEPVSLVSPVLQVDSLSLVPLVSPWRTLSEANEPGIKGQTLQDPTYM